MAHIAGTGGPIACPRCGGQRVRDLRDEWLRGEDVGCLIAPMLTIPILGDLLALLAVTAFALLHKPDQCADCGYRFDALRVKR